ncbi:MAG: hypothetical protein BWY22_02076 [Bacteroidetes bacterium ADurb.Bin217]|nr:MAG: hypothetical protein BWY22_02076 [Bacteroidetes bacterium ADurb.Bin217]
MPVAVLPDVAPFTTGVGTDKCVTVEALPCPNCFDSFAPHIYTTLLHASAMLNAPEPASTCLNVTPTGN